jgi:glycosyltransferase involved in cell wall biosynthesis
MPSESVTAVITCMTEPELPFLREAVLSVKGQTQPCRMRLYVPEDETSVEAVLGSAADGIEIRRVPLRPPGIVRNAAVDEVETEWVAFLDGDDVWLPRKVETQLAYAHQHDRIALGARHLLVREDGKPFFYGFAREMPMPSSWLIRRELLLEERFSDRLVFEDAELWQRFRGRTTPVTLKEHLIHYRVRRVSLSTPGSFEKRRKYVFARMSRFPAARGILLAASRAGALLPGRRST